MLLITFEKLMVVLGFHPIVGVLLITFEKLWLFWVSCKRSQDDHKTKSIFCVTKTFGAMVMRPLF
jgi:hypothetical protein